MTNPDASTRRKNRVVLACGVVVIVAVFLLPVFLLKLCLLVGGTGALGYGILGPDRAKRMAPGLITATIAFGVSLMVAEYVVRMVLSDITTTGDNRSYFAQRWKERLPPNNKLGFREREISSRPLETVYRIAVIGDSYTWGQGIGESDRWTNQLESILRRSVPNIEVLNFGTPGHESVDHVDTLRDVVLGLNPHFVLMQWYTNDVEGRDKSGRPTSLPLLPSESASIWLSRHSALYYLVNLQWQNLQSSLGLVESHRDYMDRRFANPQSPDMIAAQLALKEFISIAREAGVGVGIVVFPGTSTSNSVDDFPYGYLMDRVMNLCAAEGVGCVDLRPSLVGLSRDELWVNKLDGHPGVLPNRLAAETAAKHFGDRWKAAANSLAMSSR